MERNSCLPGLWLQSPAVWLPRTRISSGTYARVEYGTTLTRFLPTPTDILLYYSPHRIAIELSELSTQVFEMLKRKRCNLRTRGPSITERQPQLTFSRRQTVAKQLNGFGGQKRHHNLARKDWQPARWVPADTYRQLQRLEQNVYHLRSIRVVNHTLQSRLHKCTRKQRTHLMALNPD